MKCEDIPVEEPANPTFSRPYAPTIEACDRDYIPIKHNFSEKFEQKQYSGEYYDGQTYANGTIKKNKDGTPVKEKAQRMEGKVNPDFVKKYALTSDCHPASFVDAFLPFRKNPYTTKNNQQMSIEMLTRWNNLIASLCNAEEGGTIYPDWKRFTPKEHRKHLGLYIFMAYHLHHGLSTN